MADTKGNLRPSGLFDDFRSEMDAMMQRFFGEEASAVARTGYPSLMNAGAVRPAIDISENDKAIILTAELPGLSEEDVDLIVGDGMLTLKGEKTVSTEHKDNNSVVAERSYGGFHRSFTLPERVDQDTIEAKFDKGVLKVTMPNKPGQETGERKIKISD